jgi:Uma2 family endonuclease
LVTLLSRVVDEHKLGRVLAGEVGIYTRRDPDTVRGVDIAYISHERLKQLRSDSYLEVAPELIIEILSPGDRWSDVMEKLEEYFAIGTLMVRLVDPRRRKIQVFHSLTQLEQLGEAEQLIGGQVLAGFAVNVADLFE